MQQLYFTFSDRFEGFYTTLGLAGAGITFALREVIVSIAGWFAILFGVFFKVGDAKLEHQIFMVFNDNWIEFSLRYVVDIKARRVTKDGLFSRLLEEIEKNKRDIELASETFEIVGNQN